MKTNEYFRDFSHSKNALVSMFLTGAIVFVSMQTRNSKPLPQMENPRIVINKAKRELQVFDGFRLVKAYAVVLGFTPEGDKEKEGDGKTPEGEFYIFTKNEKSGFHLSLGLSYPNIEDAARGLQRRLISPEESDAIIKAVSEKRMPPQKTPLGGDIYIHGGGASHDWTAGCVALENEEMDELFNAVPLGTAVRITP